MGKRFLTGLILLQILVIVVGTITGVKALADWKQSYTGSPARLVLQPKVEAGAKNTVLESDLLHSRAVIERRLDRLQLAGDYQVLVQEGQLQVNLPHLENMQYVKSVLSSVGDIVFIGTGHEAPVGQWVVPASNHYQSLFGGEDVMTVELPDTATGQIFYRLTLLPPAVEQMTRFIQTSPDDYICMVMDRQVLNCSQMYHWNGQSLEILPELSSGTLLSLADLGIFLDSGPLPMEMTAVIR